MQGQYVEIIGVVQEDKSIKMLTALNIGGNIGECVLQLSDLGPDRGCRHGRRESYHRTHAYPRHGPLLVYKSLSPLTLLIANPGRRCFWRGAFHLHSDCAEARSPPESYSCIIAAPSVF
jgi:hypothetical protein